MKALRKILHFTLIDRTLPTREEARRAEGVIILIIFNHLLSDSSFQ